MNKLSASDMRRVLSGLDRIKELTDLLRRAHYDVPYHTVYGAVGAEMTIRETLYGASLSDITIEPPPIRALEIAEPIIERGARIAPSRPPSQARAAE